jgi:uncharacterized protein YqfB (UPF0267 family)
VIKGFMQRYGIDFDDTFSPVARSKSIKIILANAAKHNLELEQLDFISAFLNAELEEEIYVRIPQGFAGAGSTSKCWLLNKALYGLKQAPLRWWTTVRECLLKIGYTSIVSDPCVFFKSIKVNDKQMIILLSLYVDDTTISFHPEARELWNQDKAKIASKFKIKDLGQAHWLLNMSIERDRDQGIIKLCQYQFVMNLATKLNMLDANTVATPSIVNCDEPENAADLNEKGKEDFQSLIGSLMYAANTTRVDIAFSVNSLARHVNAPKSHHMQAAKRIVRYLLRTAKYSLIFGRDSSTAPIIEGWCDADWATAKSDRRSVTGTLVKVFGSVVAWQSKRQHTVSLSSCESEYQAISALLCEVKWIRAWMKEVFNMNVVNISCYTDSTAAIALASNSGHHARSKHIDVRHHSIREYVTSKVVNLKHVSSEEQLADILTKALGPIKFNAICNKLLTNK